MTPPPTASPTTLEELGWSPELAAAFAEIAPPGAVPGRVVRPGTRQYLLLTEAGPVTARPAGRLRQAGPPGGAGTPAVGDWVVAVPEADEPMTIHAVLPRRSTFSRQRAGRATGEQVVAANVDIVFVVAGLDGDFNLRRLERYLALAWNGGVTPVVLLNKADLCDDVDAAVAAVAEVAAGVDVHVLSAKRGDGFDAIEGHLRPGRTVAFLGSSGVGKSTMVNRLLGEERMAVRAVRASDDRGQHTTTHRELFVLSGRGLLIDTPGMRELQMPGDEGGLAAAFADIETLAAACRFRDCAHSGEPGCAVAAAIEAGDLTAARLDSYRKLGREMTAAAARQGGAVKREERLRLRKLGKLYRDIKEESRRRKGD